MPKKYEFTGETKLQVGVILKRIRRLSDGELGGWIEDERNLAQAGDAWVNDAAMVWGNANVSGDAKVWGNVCIFGNALVYGSAKVCGQVYVYGSAQIYGDAWVLDNAHVHGYAIIHGSAHLRDRGVLCGNAQVTQDSDFIYVASTRAPVTILTNGTVCANSRELTFKQWRQQGLSVLFNTEIAVITAQEQELEQVYDSVLQVIIGLEAKQRVRQLALPPTSQRRVLS